MPNSVSVHSQAQLESISPGIFGSTVPVEFDAENAKNYTAFRFTTRSGTQGVSSPTRSSICRRTSRAGSHPAITPTVR
jgi:hypothetical protein